MEVTVLCQCVQQKVYFFTDFFRTQVCPVCVYVFLSHVEPSSNVAIF